MSDDIGSVLKWIMENWAWILAFFLCFFEVTKIPISPITAIFNWIGSKLLNDVKLHIADMRDDIDRNDKEIRQSIKDQQKAIDMSRIASIRTLVLDFANSCRNNQKHSKEQFNHVMSQNGEYELLVRKYDIKNDVYKMDYEFVLHCYKECMDNNSFLA